MKPAQFTYVRAESVNQVLDALEQSPGSAKILAGGQSLNPTLNMRLSAPDLLIDINDLDELKGIKAEGDRLHVGSLQLQRRVERHLQVSSEKPNENTSFGL